MSVEQTTYPGFDRTQLGSVLGALYDRRVSYIEEIIEDIRRFGGVGVTESTLARIRESHTLFHQEMVLELTERSENCSHEAL